MLTYLGGRQSVESGEIENDDESDEVNHIDETPPTKRRKGWFRIYLFINFFT